jgi:hypothetical protein
MDLTLIGGVLKYKEPPARSDRLQQLGADSTVHKPTNTFTLGDDIVEVILETSNIMAGVSVVTVTLKGHSNLIISEGNVVDSGRGDLHVKEERIGFGGVLVSLTPRRQFQWT